MALNIHNYVPLHGTDQKGQNQQNIEINVEGDGDGDGDCGGGDEPNHHGFQYIEKSNVQYQNIEEQSPV